jgi:two-component system, NarL family, nitrate/nitrite response regulator NarL
MISLSAYAVAPVAGIGLRAILEKEEAFRMSGMFAGLNELEAHLREVSLAEPNRNEMPPNLLLLELSAQLNLNQLKRIAAVDSRTAIILWFDSVSGEYLSQAMALGVQGVLNKTSSIETHLECLKTVAGGYLWIDREANRKLLSTSRVALAPRERQVTGLLAQGLSNKEIAWSLGITEGTVKVYLSKLFDKVGVGDRFELALLALKNLSANQVAAANMPRSLDGDKVRPLSMPAFLSLDKGHGVFQSADFINAIR